MIFANMRRLLALWVGGFICAFSLHIALGAQFYFYSIGVSSGTLSSPIMLTFSQEILYPDVDINSPDIDTELSNTSTELEVFQPDFSGQEAEMLEAVDEVKPEELQHTVKKDEFEIIKSLEEPLPQKAEHKAFAKEMIPISKTMVKQSTIKMARPSTISQGGDAAAREDMLLIEWLAKIQAQLERQKKYVVKQRVSRTKGTVTLEFKVSKQGSISSSRVMVSSGDPKLDRLAMAALQRAGSFPPPPLSKVNKIIRVSLIFS
ncbi:energy transducer TonB [Bartonella alsatica]|uniref:TonB family domain-containing protein n=2 Tax=Bartonella alsatica TaxID=52764 RepID=J1IVL1_9HYPH|nr:energy transducer TonB [Bartonella alsatica]EJF75230.1 TonB family domain-containing protein [Bartonella alsatica IBS 382]QLC52392.1 energy transducer TonB [Bartonella alsatica]